MNHTVHNFFVLSTKLSIVSLNKGGQEGEAIFTFLHETLLKSFSFLCQHAEMHSGLISTLHINNNALLSSFFVTFSAKKIKLEGIFCTIYLILLDVKYADSGTFSAGATLGLEMDSTWGKEIM